MFASSTYTPYPGTSFTWDGTQILRASCPWLAMDVDIDPDQHAALADVVERIEGTPSSIADDDVQDFLRFFAGYPLLHVNPRQFGPGVAPYDSRADELADAAGPLQFLRAINPFPEIDLDAAFSYFPQAWEWDLQPILEAAAIPGSDLYDPMSVYTAIRARRLQFQIEQSHHARNLLAHLDTLRRENEPVFFKVMAIILSQQYYVTGQCDHCLTPAAGHHGLIRDQVMAYMGEEQNHDRLILRSIRAISDEEPENFIYVPEVKLEIEVIKYSARTCALGFSALVSIMEGTVYPESDPVGDILRQSSRPASHAGVEAHFQINRGSNHTAIPETFVEQLPPVTETTVRNAVRLAETTIRLDSGLALTMTSHLKQLRKLHA
jgi:hypothetical protein